MSQPGESGAGAGRRRIRRLPFGLRPIWRAAVLTGALALPGGPLTSQEEPALEERPPTGAPAAESPVPTEPEAASATQPPPATQPPAPPPPATVSPPPATHSEFSLPVPPEKGGGTITGSAGTVEYLRKDVVRLSDGVDLRYRDLKIQAQAMEADLSINEVTAEGEVILDQGPRRVTGATVRYNLDTQTGTFTDAAAYVDPDFFFVGEEIAKVGDDVYTVRKGLFTSCTDRVPDWSFKVAHARVRVEGFARAQHVRMRAKKVPFLYLPYILWPAKSDRTSGLLVPNVGFSERRGSYIGLAWFQVFGRSYDTTFYADHYGEGYYGLGNEFRYVPSEATSGELQAYALQDPFVDETRWKVSWTHIDDELPGGFRGVANYLAYSDFDFFREFERDFNDASLRSVYASAYASKSWGPHSLNVLADDRETFITAGTITQQQLPEVQYRLRPTRLGPLPLYLELLSSASYLSSERSVTLRSDYGRGDLFPQLTVPVSSLPWLSLSLTGGGRLTWYGDSLTEDGIAYSGESLTRVFPDYGADIVGPSFSRIFDGDAGPFDKFKHIVEPRWSYAYVDRFDDQDLVPLFDEVDNIRPVNLGAFALVNRLLAKPRPGIEGDTREILSFELSQAYSLDETRPLERSSDGILTSQRGPVGARLRFYPSDDFTLETQATYSTLFDELAATSLSSTYNVGTAQLGATWFTRFNVEAAETTSNQVRFFASFDVVPRRLRLDAQINYDFELAFFQQQRYIFQYLADCWGMRVELRELNLGATRERDYRFAVDLKNVGTFLDLTGGFDSDSRR